MRVNADSPPVREFVRLIRFIVDLYDDNRVFVSTFFLLINSGGQWHHYDFFVIRHSGIGGNE